MAIDREKAARREIGRLTAERQGLKDSVVKITSPPAMERAPRYQRCAIDYSILDNMGHGVPEQTNARMINRTHSIVSGDSMGGAYPASHLNNSTNGLYERWIPSQIPHGMVSAYLCSFIQRSLVRTRYHSNSQRPIRNPTNSTKLLQPVHDSASQSSAADE
jgi:hypothetical protein